MDIPSNVKELYDRYFETNEELKRLEHDKTELKNAILAHLGDQRAVIEHGYSVKLTPGTRKTACTPLIESTFGIKLTDDCFKVTTYDSLAVTRL